MLINNHKLLDEIQLKMLVKELSLMVPYKPWNKYF